MKKERIKEIIHNVISSNKIPTNDKLALILLDDALCKAIDAEEDEDVISRKTIKAIPLEKFKEMDKEIRNYFATTFYPSLSGVLMILHKHVELINSPTREHGE